MKKNIEDLNRISKDEMKKSKKMPLIVVLDNIRSLHNVGSVFRTSDAFRVESIYLCGITACPPNKEIDKTALGATESVEWKYFDNIEKAILDLKTKAYTIVGIEQCFESVGIDDLGSISEKNKMAIVMGNEVFGISDEIVPLCDKIVELPQYGTKHSLNVSVCAGIIIWEVFRRSIFYKNKFM